MFTVSALATTLFLGGWRAPWPISVWAGRQHRLVAGAVVPVKLFVFLFVFIWLRGTLPRVRYDQLMTLGWKVLIPVILVWILLVATVRGLRSRTADSAPLRTWSSAGHRARAGLLIAMLGQRGDSSGPQRSQAADRPTGRGRRPASSRCRRWTGFPVPPLDLPHYHGAGVAGDSETPSEGGLTGA